MTVWVFDANTVVSAALKPEGTPRRAITTAREHGVIGLSEAVYLEIASVLARPKFARVLTVDRHREILALLEAAAVWVEPKEPVGDYRDAKDTRYLELALAARATAVISSDQDVLVLDPWRAVRVLRLAAFVSMLAAG